MTDSTHAKPTSPYLKVVELIAPWTLSTTLLLWGWRVEGLFGGIPAYGDVLEVLWGIEWYGDHFPGAASFFYPLIFHPEGWHVAAFGYAPGMFIQLMPLYEFGEAVFAYDAAVILSFIVAFAGTYRLARRFTRSRFSATLAALLFTFWGFRWLRVHGHLNILIASSLLPWMAWSLERALGAPHRSVIWFGMVGATWALSISNTLYFTWVGGTLVLVWTACRCLTGYANWRAALRGALVSCLVALLLSAPVLFWTFRDGAAAGVSFSSYDINHVNSWGASLNSLPVPFVFHPWLQPIARWLYRGPLDESGTANLGLVGTIVSLIGLQAVWRDKKWRPILFVTVAGLLLTLGLTLRWDGEAVQCTWLRPLNVAIWRIGHVLKPGFFPSDHPPSPFDEAIPMPGLVLAAILPYWEATRVLSRYVLVAGLGFFILVARGVERGRRFTVQLALAALLVAEIVPPPTGSVHIPAQPHPAFAWLKQHTLPQEGIADLYAPQPGILSMPIGGETLWATQFHSRPTVAGASSVWPAHTMFLLKWLWGHPHAFAHSDFVPLLRYYDVHTILLHMQGENEWRALEEAQGNTEVQLTQCFDPPTQPTPWPHSICVFRILPPANPHFNVLFREGWSSEEFWGIWADGMDSHARWVATSQADYIISLEGFPHCAPGKNQVLSLEVNGEQLVTHQWENCEPWSREIIVPASAVQIGWNDVWLHYTYAIRPADLTDGENPDPRLLSVGFTRLEVEKR